MENHALGDAITFGQSLGILPASIEDDTERLNVKSAMKYLSEEIIDVFFDRTVIYCDHEMVEMLCLEKVRGQEIYKYPELVSEMFENLQLNKNYKNRIEEGLELYLGKRKLTEDSFESDCNDTMILQIKELNEKFPSKHVNWLQMINNQLLNDSLVTTEDKILIRDPQSFEKFYILFAELEER